MGSVGNGCGVVNVNSASDYLGDILFVLGFHSLVLLYKSSMLREWWNRNFDDLLLKGVFVYGSVTV